MTEKRFVVDRDEEEQRKGGGTTTKGFLLLGGAARRREERVANWENKQKTAIETDTSSMRYKEQRGKFPPFPQRLLFFSLSTHSRVALMEQILPSHSHTFHTLFPFSQLL